MSIFGNFQGRAKKIDDLDLPRIAHAIGAGEDEVHMLIEVETSGSGFDKSFRPKMLFEPHVFYRNLSGAEREAAVAQGLAYPKWKKGYPADSYPRLIAAMKINETAAVKSASWGLGQILGENFAMAGYGSPQKMVLSFMDDEENHLQAMINFVKASGLDDDLRALAALTRATVPDDCRIIARIYNGPAYEKNGYHTKMAAAHNRWRKIPDTPWSPDVDAPTPVTVAPVEVKPVEVTPVAAGPSIWQLLFDLINKLLKGTKK